MTTVRVRLLGGLLNGKVLWIEENCESVKVKVAGGSGLATRTLQYRRDGVTAVFESELLAAPIP